MLAADSVSVVIARFEPRHSYARCRLYEFHEAPMTCLYGTFCIPCLYGENVNREEGSSCVLNCVVRCLQIVDNADIVLIVVIVFPNLMVAML